MLNSSWSRAINENTYWTIITFSFEALLLFLIFECYAWLLFFFNCLSKVWWISFFIMSGSVLFIPKNSAVLTLINQLHVDAVIKRCSAKYVQGIPDNRKILEKYLWINSDLIKMQFLSMLLFFHRKNEINNFSFQVFSKLFVKLLW